MRYITILQEAQILDLEVAFTIRSSNTTKARAKLDIFEDKTLATIQQILDPELVLTKKQFKKYIDLPGRNKNTATNVVKKNIITKQLVSHYTTNTEQTKESKPLQSLRLEEEAVQAQIDRLELATKQAELATQELEAKAQELRAQEATLETEQAINNILEQRLATLEHKQALELRLTAYTETLEQIRAKVRLTQNLERVFTPHQRDQLYLNAGGKCQHCGDSVQYQAFEADHIQPFSLGGLTTLENGQCLCRSCNRTKGNRYDV